MLARVRWLVALALLSAPSPLLAQDPGGGSENRGPTVSVTGEGEARAVPDRAFVILGVESRAASASEAAADNARRQRAVLDTLRAMGFTQEQLATANYSVRPELQYDQEGQRPRVLGYVVSNTVRVDVRQTERVGPVIDAALARGANQVHGLHFYLSDPAPARRDAIANAVAKARADAEALARAAGGSLGEVLELSTAPMPSGPVMYRQNIEVLAMRGDASTPVQAGEEVVRATVHARWAFVPGR